MSTKQTHRFLLTILLLPAAVLAGITLVAPPGASTASAKYPTRVIKLALTQAATLDIPAGLVDGETIRWWVTQDAGAPYTLTPGTDVLLPAGSTTLDLPSDDSSVSLIVGAYDADAGVVRLTGFLKYAR